MKRNWCASLAPWLLCAWTCAARAAEPPVMVPQLGHTGYIRSVAVSPDSRFLATCGADQSILVWELATRRVWAELHGHTGTVMAVAWSPDGTRLASCAEDATVRLWDPLRGRPVGEPLRRHGSYVNSLAWRSDGRLLATAGGYGETGLCLWNGATGEPVAEKQLSLGQSVSFSPDRRLLVAAAQGGTLQLADGTTAAPLGPPWGGGDEIVCLAFAPTGRLVATGGTGQSLRLWDVPQRRCAAVLRGHNGDLNAVAWSPDGARLASGSEDGTVRLWDATGKPVGTPLPHPDRVFAVTWCPDGKRVVTGCHDGVARLWDATTGQLLGAPFRGRTSRVEHLAWQPGGRLLAYNCANASGGLWDLERAEAFGAQFDAGGLAWSPDGQVLALAGTDNAIRLCRPAATGTTLPPLVGHEDLVAGLAFSPDGQFLATGSYDRTVRLWSTATGQPRGQPLTGHTAAINAVAVSPDSRLVASASSDRSVRLWNAATGQLQRAPLAHGSLVGCLAFSPDGRALACGEGYGSQVVRLWDVATGQLRRPPIETGSGEVNAVAWSPDGRWLASAGGDGTATLWDGATGQRVGAPFDGRGGRMLSLAWSADGQTLATGSSSSTCLWNVATRTPRAHLYSLDRGVASLLVTPEGYYSGSLEGARQVCWRIGTGLFPAEQLEARFRRPDLVAAAVAGAVPATQPPALGPQDMPPAVTIEILAGPPGAAADQVRVRIVVTPGRPDGTVSRLEVRVNGRAVELERAQDLNASGGAARSIGLGHGRVEVSHRPDQAAVSLEASLRLLPGEDTAKLSASAWDERELRGDSAVVGVPRRVDGTKSTPVPPNLYVLAVGVSAYRTREYNLTYADADARALGEVLAQQQGRAFGRVESRVLVNEQATLATVRAGFAWLRTAASERDVAIVLLGGHGIRGQTGRLFFATHECDLDSLRDTCLPWTEVSEALAACHAGQRLLLLDCCHAGSFGLRPDPGARFVFVPVRGPLGQWAAGPDDLTRDVVGSSGVMVLAGCKGAEVAYERAEWGHGAFTGAVLEGLAGKADPYRQGVITVANLLGYVQARVAELTDQHQTPWIPRAEQFDTSLVLARVR